MRNGLAGEAGVELAENEVADEHRENDRHEAGDKAEVLEHDGVADTADHAHTAALAERADDKTRDERETPRGMHAAGTFFGELEERRSGEPEDEQQHIDDREGGAFGERLLIAAAEREALLEEHNAHENAHDEAHKTDKGVPVTAADTDDHTQRAAEEHQRADHDERAEKEADHRGRAAAALEFLRRDRRDERAEQDADDLRTEVLHDLRAVHAERAGRVAQEAGDAEAHVAGVAVRAQNERRNADHKSGDEDQPVVFQPVVFHFFPSLFKRLFGRPHYTALRRKMPNGKSDIAGVSIGKTDEKPISAAPGG